ncbi:MAG: methionine aminotransferase [Bacteroidota bacterium]
MKSKLPNLGTTIFTTMSALAVQEGALNMGQGFPGFPIDEKLIDLVSKAMKEGFNQYAPMPGMPVLRQIITEQLNARYGCNYDWNSEVNITAGASQAIFTAISTLVFPGDEVILFAPAYDCYAPAVELNGGKVVWIELEGEDFHIPWDKVKSSINDRTKLMLVNTPHNPTGAVNTLADAHHLLNVVRETNVFVISDEVYEHIVFEGRKNESLAQFEELRERLMLVYSFGKTFHATGWKLGYAVCDAKWMVEFRKQHQFNVFTCNAPFQIAIAEYMKTADYSEISRMFERKRNLFVEALAGSRWKVLPCAGTYFQVIDYSEISDEGDFDFAVKLNRKAKITSIPLSPFYENGSVGKRLRFCFAKKEEELFEAAHRLRDFAL